MPVIDTRALRVVWTVFLFGAFAALVYAIRETLMVFMLALFLAQLLSPVVDVVERFVRNRAPRTVALVVVYIALLGGGVAILIPLIGKIVEEASALGSKLPQAIHSDPLANVRLPYWLEFVRPKLADALRTQMSALDDRVLPMLTGAGQKILSGLGSVASVILIPILSFFFLKDGVGLRDSIVEYFSRKNRLVVSGILSDLHELLQHYTRALLLLAAATFISHVTVLSLMGVPYFVLLAGIAAVLEFIPVVGPLVSAVVMLLVAAFAGYPHVLWIVVFLVLYRVFQDYVLNPYLMSSGVDVHFMLVIFGVLAGEQVAGIPGMFFAVPLIAAVRVIFRRLHEDADAA